MKIALEMDGGSRGKRSKSQWISFKEGGGGQQSARGMGAAGQVRVRVCPVGMFQIQPAAWVCTVHGLEASERAGDAMRCDGRHGRPRRACIVLFFSNLCAFPLAVCELARVCVCVCLLQKEGACARCGAALCDACDATCEIWYVLRCAR